MSLGAFLFKIRCREVATGVFSLSDADAVQRARGGMGRRVLENARKIS